MGSASKRGKFRRQLDNVLCGAVASTCGLASFGRANSMGAGHSPKVRRSLACDGHSKTVLQDVQTLVSPTMPNPPDAVQTAPLITIPGSVRHLLLRITEGWSPSNVQLSSVKALCIDDIDCTDMNPLVEVAADRLIVTLKNAHVHPRLRDLLPFSLDRRIEGTLTTGEAILGDNILRVSLGADLKIEAATWTVQRADVGPSLWVGQLEGELAVDFGGNLIVERLRKDGLFFGRACHFRLAGAFTYYLVQRGERKAAAWHLVVDAGSCIPDKEALERDFQLLQFVLGRQLRVPTLLRVVKEGSTCAATNGLGSRSNLNPRSVPPVPINRDNDDFIDASWAALLFDRASATMSAKPKARTAFWIALDAYLDGMGQHLDADYLRLHVGLEAFAYWLLRLANEEEPMVVRDKVAWKNWVKENSVAIRALAAKGSEESLFQKVMTLYRLASGRVVPNAFQAHDLPLSDELKRELEGRDDVVHQGLMAPEGNEGDRDLQRIAMVRTMLVALIARAAGYRGAINGWDVGKAGYPLVPTEWWVVDGTDRLLAHQKYLADDSVHGDAPSEGG